MSETRESGSAPVDNDIPELDRICEQYNSGEIDLCTLVCRVWNTALNQGHQAKRQKLTGQGEDTEASWFVRKDANNHWGMREVVGPSVSVVGFTVATNVSAQRARQVEEDARLIAAAPDLLKACKIVLMLSLPHDVSGQRMVDKARQAVDKAEGR